MPAEMLTDGPNRLNRGVEIEGVLDLGAREVDQANHALTPTSRMSQPLRPCYLTHGIVGNELRPYGLHNAQSVDVPCVILGKVYPRQGPVIADESLEASTALHEHGVAQPSCVNEMLMTVNDREPLTFHDGGALLLVNEARHGVLLQSRG